MMRSELPTETKTIETIVANTTTTMHMEGWAGTVAFSVMCAAATTLGICGMRLYEKIMLNEPQKETKQ